MFTSAIQRLASSQMCWPTTIITQTKMTVRLCSALPVSTGQLEITMICYLLGFHVWRWEAEILRSMHSPGEKHFSSLNIECCLSDRSLSVHFKVAVARGIVFPCLSICVSIFSTFRNALRESRKTWHIYSRRPKNQLIKFLLARSQKVTVPCKQIINSTVKN